jgi:hypothetical protein
MASIGARGSRQPGGGYHPGSAGRGLDEFTAMQVLRHRYPPSTDIPRIRVNLSHDRVMERIEQR